MSKDEQLDFRAEPYILEGVEDKKPSVRTNNTVSYLGVAVYSAFIGFLGGLYFGVNAGRNNAEPQEVYVNRVDEDNRPDVVIKMERKTLTYLGQDNKSGLCKKLEDVETETVKGIKDRVK